MLIDLIFGRNCLICNSFIKNRYYPSWICKDCYKKIFFIKKIYCKRCGSPFHSKCLCGLLNKEISTVRSLFIYDDVGKELIHKWKYSGYFFIAELFKKKILNYDFSKFDGIMAVPLSLYKMVKRGFNQALIISKFISEHFKIKNFSNLISRKYSKPQMEIDDYILRRENVKGIFKLKNLPECDKLLIVDDIITSCSTVNEITNLLKKSGFQGEISIFTISMAL